MLSSSGPWRRRAVVDFLRARRLARRTASSAEVDGFIRSLGIVVRSSETFKDEKCALSPSCVILSCFKGHAAQAIESFGPIGPGVPFRVATRLREISDLESSQAAVCALSHRLPPSRWTPYGTLQSSPRAQTRRRMDPARGGHGSSERLSLSLPFIPRRILETDGHMHRRGSSLER